MSVPRSNDSTVGWERGLDRAAWSARVAAAASTPPTPIAAATGERLPSLRDKSVWLLLAFVALLQAIAWSRIDGYQIADSVEFMERARIVVRGEEMVDAGAIRPFGFSTVLLPFFALADWYGLQDPRAIMWTICIVQNLLGLSLVVVVVRIGARLVDVRTGMVAGLLTGSNPVFLQYSTQPISGIAAAVCVALAIESLLERGNFRRSLIGGLWLGAALLMAYQSILIILVIGALVLVRDRARARPTFGGLACGVAIGLGVQIVLDKLGYGRFGASLWNYAVQNFLTVLTSITLQLGWTKGAIYLYGVLHRATGSSYQTAEDLSVRGLQSPWFYLENLPSMLVWPVIGLLILGCLRSLRRPNWKTGFLLLCFAANVAILSNKGSKGFRLWLPLLPMVAPLCAYGGAPLWSAAARGRASLIQVVSTALVLATMLFMNLDALLALRTRQFSGYWRAIDWVNAHAAENRLRRAALSRGPTPARLRVGSAYNWAVYMRESPLVELVKLPWQLNQWPKYAADQHADDLASIEELDVFITHLPILTNHLDLFEWVNELFQVEGAFYDQETYESGLGPIFVLVRSHGERGRRFFQIRSPAQAEEFRARQRLEGEAHFVPNDESKQRAVLLGFEYEEVPPEGLGWITYHWTTPTGLSRDYTIIDRLTSADERNAWQNNHTPGHGLFPTTSWKPGEILSEGYLVVPASEPYLPESFFRPIGGAYRRGDLIPVSLWMALLEYDLEELQRGVPLVRSRLFSARPNEDLAMRPEAQGSLVTHDGYEFSHDWMIRVGRFFLPVHPAARLADDGRPVPE